MRPCLPTELLVTFVAIVNRGKFSLAAEDVNRTQSAVSMQIKKLEELVGSPLLQRDRRDISLTSAGEMLLSYARKILQLNEEAVAKLASPGLFGKVRIGVPEEYAERFLPKILASFANDHPNVRVEITCDLSTQLRVLIQKQQLDIALATSGVLEPEAKLLKRPPLVWVTSDQHFQHEKKPLPLALSVGDCYCKDLALKALKDAAIDYWIAFSSKSTLGLMSAVKAGLAVTVSNGGVQQEGLRQLGEAEGFPVLPETYLALHRNPSSNNAAADSLAEYLYRAFTEK